MARIFTVDQAAEYLHVTPYTIRKWLRKGKIPGWKIGRLYRIFEAELEAMLRGAVDLQDTLEEQGLLSPAERSGLSQEERDRRVRAARGMFAGGSRTLDDFLREKHEEIEEEELRHRAGDQSRGGQTT